MTTTPITKDECRELAKRLGIEWHGKTIWHKSCGQNITCDCGAMFVREKDLRYHVADNHNEDFTDARVALRLAMVRDDWHDFANDLRMKERGWWISTIEFCLSTEFLLDTTGQLAKLLLKWLREKEHP